MWYVCMFHMIVVHIQMLYLSTPYGSGSQFLTSPLSHILLLLVMCTEALDFAVTTGEIVIPSNTTQYDLEVEIINDAIREGREEFEVVISVSGSGAAVTLITLGIKTARIAIIDDDSECD